MMLPLLAVCGKGKNALPHIRDMAYSVGYRIGDHLGDRIGLVTGGLTGVMDAALLGYRDAGGALTVGILPGTQYREEGGVTEHADVLVDTGQPSQVRNWALVNTAGAVIILPGSHGTWQETAFALDLEKPVWGLGNHDVLFPGVVYCGSLGELEMNVAHWVEPVRIPNCEVGMR